MPRKPVSPAGAKKKVEVFLDPKQIAWLTLRGKPSEVLRTILNDLMNERIPTDVTKHFCSKCQRLGINPNCDCQK